MDLAALAAGAAGSLFGYNRENYFFDGEQRIKREYQGQTMRVKQFELFREDIRDLMNLTVAKMDNYLIVNTIQIGLVVVLFTEGRPDPGAAPPWLLCLWAASGAGSFMYITLCIWLAMHASICSHSFCVRMLTQVVRLPIPTKEQLDAARVLATDFEGTKVREMLRVPVVNQQLKKLHSMVDHLNDDQSAVTHVGSDGSDVWEETMLDADGHPVATDTLAHVRLYRKMQANWQAYDAYARVSMAMGTNQFLQQLGYTCLIGFITENKSILPGMCSVAIFSICAALLIRLDLFLPWRSLILAGLLNTLPPMVAGISLILKLAAPKSHGPGDWELVGDAMVLFVFLLHIIWLILLLNWAKGKKINNLALPTIFRAVLYLDVFGWLSSQEVPQGLVAAAGGVQEAEDGGRSALSIVREEEQWQPPAQIPFTAVAVETAAAASGAPGDAECPCRQSLRDSLAKLCSEMNRDLDRDLGAFESEDVSALMETYEKQAVSDLRQQLKEIVGNLSLEVDPSSTEASAAVAVWVRLDWNPSGRATQFFRRVRSQDTSVVWTRPMPPDIVLELDEISLRLDSFKMKVQTLVSQFSEEVTQSFEASSCRNSSTGSGDAASEQLWHLPEAATADATEQQQESRESVQLAESTTAQDADPQRLEAAGGFHPHQAREEDARRLAFAEPGQLPWNTVKQGSLILIGAWCVSLVWSILRLWVDFVDILTPPLPASPDLDLLYKGPWPRFFEPQGLACSFTDDESERLLIAEKHDVHQLVFLNEDRSWHLSRSELEAHCLATAPEFHAAGVRGISLDCAEREVCASLLMGEGTAVLQCERNSSSELHFFGGPWRVASGRSSEGGFWAHRAVEKSPVLLQPSGGSQSGHFVPSMQLGSHPAAQHEFLDTLQGGGLLGMSQQGRLHAWQSESWLPSDWFHDLPKEMGLRWLGMCTAGKSAFLLGKGAGTPGRVELWRVQLSSLLQ